VATRWRIRHKLLLGFGLVMVVMILLLLGTLRGLWSYHQTTMRIRYELDELLRAEQLRNYLADLVEPEQAARLGDNEERLRQAMLAYRAALDERQEAWNDPLEGVFERGKLEDLDKALIAFRATAAAQPTARVGPNRTSADEEKKGRERLDREGKELLRHADDLCKHIKEELNRRLTTESRRHYQMTLWVIVPVSILGICIMLGLMWSFYGWVFHPIRDLTAGVAKVNAGNLGHRIHVASGDEMEELGKTFNHMLDQLEGLMKNLEGQVNERSRQLVRSERLASVGFLAAGVAHEINNPLASIAFCSEALEARLEELPRHLRNPARAAEEQETFHKYLKMIQNEAFRCKSITERLLEFSRTGEPRREQTELRTLVQSVLDVTQHLPNHKGKQIVFEVAAGRIAAPVNGEEIKSVILNLVVNALESMDDGGKLVIRLTQKDGFAELRFIDSGCGMTREVLDNIFEPFFTRSRTGKGTGLGLTISHLVVSQHGGEIEAHSEGPGLGSTFLVRLPLKAAETAPVQGATPVGQAGQPPLNRAA
jgi:signal transduction histidine kinase